MYRYTLKSGSTESYDLREFEGKENDITLCLPAFDNHTFKYNKNIDIEKSIYYRLKELREANRLYLWYSGGFDSELILYYMMKYKIYPDEIFFQSYGLDMFESDYSLELGYARDKLYKYDLPKSVKITHVELLSKQPFEYFYENMEEFFEKNYVNTFNLSFLMSHNFHLYPSEFFTTTNLFTHEEIHLFGAKSPFIIKNEGGDYTTNIKYYQVLEQRTGSYYKRPQMLAADSGWFYNDYCNVFINHIESLSGPALEYYNTYCLWEGNRKNKQQVLRTTFTEVSARVDETKQVSKTDNQSHSIISKYNLFLDHVNYPPKMASVLRYLIKHQPHVIKKFSELLEENEKYLPLYNASSKIQTQTKVFTGSLK